MDGDNMTFDNELILISKASSGTNDLGDSIPVETRTSVLCGVRSVTRSERYAAAAHGLQPEYVFIVNKYEYSGQMDVEYAGKPYRVIRTFIPDKAKELGDFENLELVCQGVK